jgi:hypothetical protein
MIAVPPPTGDGWELHVQNARSDERLIERIDRANETVCAAQLEFLRLVARVDSLELWRGDGSADMAHWLVVRYGISDWKARRWIAASQSLVGLPRVAEAMARGDLGIDKVVELTRFATPGTEAELVAWARDVSAGRIRHRGDLARRETDDEVREADEARSLTWWWYDDGRRFGLQGDLPAAQGAVVARAIGRLADSLPAMPGEEHSFFTERRRADALVALAATRLAEDQEPDRATLIVHARVDGDGRPTGGFEVEGGPAIPEQTARRLLCTARIQTVLENTSGDVIGLGRMTREPPEWMNRQLRLRDRGCTFPGCTATQWTQAHHIRWWSRGGTTDLDNLVLTCLFHHKLVHEYGWTIRRERTGDVIWLRPDGIRFHAGPAPPFQAGAA